MTGGEETFCFAVGDLYSQGQLTQASADSKEREVDADLKTGLSPRHRNEVPGGPNDFLKVAQIWIFI